MADQIFMPRALDENGDTLTAYAYFYTAGTTTPLSVYANQTLTVTHPTPLPSDAAGAFPQVFVASGTAVRTDVRDADTVEGSSLPGYPVDPSPVMSIASSAASSVAFSPITGNASTDVQTAIAVNTNRHETRSADVKDLLTSSNDSEFRTKLGLGTAATVNVIDEDSFATDSATRPPSQQSTKAYIESSVNARMYESPQTTIAVGTQYLFNHGLGVIPDLVKVELVCTTADNGWSVGHRIQMDLSADSNAGIAVRKTDSQLVVRIGDSGPGYYIAGAGFTSAALDAADWALIVRAFRFS